MFRGNCPAKIDAQGRLKIPALHRKVMKQFGTDMFVTSITGENVLIYPMSEWEQLERKLLEPPKMLPGKVKFLRNTSYYGQVAKMDKQGRIVIQPHLREAAAMNGEITVIGSLTHIEVWNLARFMKVLESDPFFDEDASALAELGI